MMGIIEDDIINNNNSTDKSFTPPVLSESDESMPSFDYYKPPIDRSRLQPADPPKRLHVTNIPFRFREVHLTMMFDKFGPVLESEVIFNERGSKGYGFVSMKYNEDAYMARKLLHGCVVEGRRIVVNDATVKNYRAKKSKSETSVVESPVPNSLVPNILPLMSPQLAQSVSCSGLVPSHLQPSIQLQLAAVLQTQQQMHLASQLAAIQNANTLNACLTEQFRRLQFNATQNVATPQAHIGTGVGNEQQGGFLGSTWGLGLPQMPNLANASGFEQWSSGLN